MNLIEAGVRSLLLHQIHDRTAHIYLDVGRLAHSHAA